MTDGPRRVRVATAIAALALGIGCTGERAAPGAANGVHPAGIADPRSPDFHGAALRAVLYAPMLDATSDSACGRCHDGTLSRPADVTSSAPGATACTSCHQQEKGVLACATCHGMGQAPPHAAHVDATATHSIGFPCSTCHPTPGDAVFGGQHIDGMVEVRFETPAAPDGAFDPQSRACTVSCHARGGAHPDPTWTAAAKPFGCGDCHGAPPAAHFPGACSTCHREADATGTALTGGPLHMNGLVDVGDGSGGCGACHGNGVDAWPATAAHPAHRSPATTVPVDCTTCHPVPTTVQAPGHLDGVVQIAFAGRALDRGSMPAWNGTTCADVACHGAGLTVPPAFVPEWRDSSGKAKACGACHGIPPTQHTPSSQCGRSDCHGGEVSTAGGVPAITAAGRMAHIDGLIEVNRP